MFKNLLAPAVVAITAMASSPAFAGFEDFCVDSLALAGTSATAGYTGLVNGANGCTNGVTQGFTADKLNGGYSERLVVTATANPLLLNFTSTVFVEWGQFFRNEGANGISGALSLMENQYDLYAVVRATGTLSLATGQFSASGASLELWADQFLAVGGGITERTGWDAGLNPVLTNAGDDELLLTADFMDGAGTASAPGRFTFNFDEVVLTALGDAFFIAPRPFYVDLQSDGDVDTQGFNVTGPGQFDLAGDISANFFIPEPGSLALAGLALMGLGLSRRRKAA